jgi:hypothetical protein
MDSDSSSSTIGASNFKANNTIKHSSFDELTDPEEAFEFNGYLNLGNDAYKEHMKARISSAQNQMK